MTVILILLASVRSFYIDWYWINRLHGIFAQRTVRRQRVLSGWNRSAESECKSDLMKSVLMLLFSPLTQIRLELWPPQKAYLFTVLFQCHFNSKMERFTVPKKDFHSVSPPIGTYFYLYSTQPHFSKPRFVNRTTDLGCKHIL